MEKRETWHYCLCSGLPAGCLLRRALPSGLFNPDPIPGDFHVFVPFATQLAASDVRQTPTGNNLSHAGDGTDTYFQCPEMQAPEPWCALERQW